MSNDPNTPGVRVTDLNISSYTRLAYTNIVRALQSVFNIDYNRDAQFEELKITPQYPLQKIDYPAIVVDFQASQNLNAGVGHYEIFPDPRGRLRKWFHRRFEGTITFNVYALTPLDRDILIDAVTEVVAFGRLDPHLTRFYEQIYPTPDPPPVHAEDDYGLDYSYLMFSQLMLNSDVIRGVGNSTGPAPWQPEDVLQFTGGISMDLHGGYYNTDPQVDYSHVTRIVIDAYQEDQVGVELPFPGHAEIAWDPPTTTTDGGTVRGRANISSVEEHETPAQETLDAWTVRGTAVITGVEAHDDL